MNTLELARELIRKPSVTPADAGCQALIAELLGDAGFHDRAPEDSAKSTTSGRGAAAAGPALVFAGHTDVVPTGPARAMASRSVRGDGAGGAAHRPRRGRHEGQPRRDGQRVPALRRDAIRTHRVRSAC